MYVVSADGCRYHYFSTFTLIHVWTIFNTHIELVHILIGCFLFNNLSRKEYYAQVPTISFLRIISLIINSRYL